MNIKDKLVLALDVDTKEEALALVRELKDCVGVFKIGLQLLTREGSQLIRILKEEDCKIFYDAKFHDIPNTVASAAVNAMRLGVDIFDVHISGGREMIELCIKELEAEAEKIDRQAPVVLGITILSSLNGNNLNMDLLIPGNVGDYVKHLAGMAKTSGLSGVVASVNECRLIKETCGNDFIVLCPGIRPEYSDCNDQKRISTPKHAIESGADYIVVGRPILQARDKRYMTLKILEEMEDGLNLLNQNRLCTVY